MRYVSFMDFYTFFMLVGIAGIVASFYGYMFFLVCALFLNMSRKDISLF